MLIDITLPSISYTFLNSVLTPPPLLNPPPRAVFHLPSPATMATIGMFNVEGENVDLYIPRKCHATNTLIEAHDHAAVQISIANVGPNGVINGTTTTLCIAGYLRSQGESDHAINHIAIDRGIVRIKTGKPKRVSKSKSKKPVAKGAAAGAAAQKGQKGQRSAGAAGGRPGAQKGARPPTQKGARPPAQKGARPPAQRGAAPARKNRA
ncbi:hypothetical protein GH5_06639 [Leishmania sp. Ghana 2012 LV757]|uniref:hypothetical protein n=1 Tax=Leishmania sp. Ghana 2012 LV757 TaxID=2803181 RepID=UPI001B6C1451|nr:hypothetical protein GH5_06639 [Leishmania sp. Ghana 2012 LV757]